MLKLENAIQAKDVKRDLLGMQDFNELLMNGTEILMNHRFCSDHNCGALHIYIQHYHVKLNTFFFFFPELLISHECCLSHFKYYIWPWKSLSKVA
jgi:hypothetical protein